MRDGARGFGGLWVSVSALTPNTQHTAPALCTLRYIFRVHVTRTKPRRSARGNTTVDRGARLPVYYNHSVLLNNPVVAYLLVGRAELLKLNKGTIAITHSQQL